MSHQGAPASELFLITTGRARYFSTGPDGQKMLLAWMTPGEIIGGAALLSAPAAYRVSAEAVGDTSVLVWSREVIRALIERYPRISENAFTFAFDYLDWYVAAHTALICHTARQRLAGVLLSLAPRLGRAVPGGIEFDATNEELASAANITPFTTSRLLNEWQRQGAVEKRRGKIVLLAPDRLVALTT